MFRPRLDCGGGVVGDRFDTGGGHG
jgi:hypothetical protein